MMNPSSDSIVNFVTHPASAIWLSLVRQERAIAVIRSAHIGLGQQMARAVAAGGMRLIEVTWNSDRPAELIAALRRELPDHVIGAGTLLSVADVEAAIAAGAQFLFTPHAAPLLIHAAITQAVPIVAGALTPTEILTAWQAGATCVKVFPIQVVGGVEYLKAIREPLNQIPLIPTGGVTIENAHQFIQAGAVAVGLAGQLFPQAAIARGDWSMVTQQAIRLREAVQSAVPKN